MKIKKETNIYNYLPYPPIHLHPLKKWPLHYKGYFSRLYRVFSHDVTAAILVSQNNETAAMLVSQTNPVGV